LRRIDLSLKRGLDGFDLDQDLAPPGGPGGTGRRAKDR